MCHFIWPCRVCFSTGSRCVRATTTCFFSKSVSFAPHWGELRCQTYLQRQAVVCWKCEEPLQELQSTFLFLGKSTWHFLLVATCIPSYVIYVIRDWEERSQARRSFQKLSVWQLRLHGEHRTTNNNKAKTKQKMQASQVVRQSGQELRLKSTAPDIDVKRQDGGQNSTRLELSATLRHVQASWEDNDALTRLFVWWRGAGPQLAESGKFANQSS